MTALSTSIQSVLTIVLLIAVGYVLRRQGRFDDQFGKTISDLLMKIALPASIFISVLQRLTLNKLVSLSSGLVYGFGAVILGYLIAFCWFGCLKFGQDGVALSSTCSSTPTPFSSAYR
ncbi:AEC family transporter [Lacticaseibacillus rhamnosus]